MPDTCFARYLFCPCRQEGRTAAGAGAGALSRRLSLSPEERELHASVAPLLPEFRICGEVHLLRMFENQHAFGTQQVVFEHQPYDLLAARQIVGGVRENHVELPYSASIRFIVAWKGEDDTEETAVVLPDIYLRK